MKTRVFEKFMGLDYLTMTLPIRVSAKAGEVVAADPADVEKAVARIILEKPITIRGIEAKLLRKFMGLSMEKFAREIDVSSSTIFHWEDKVHTPIGTVNEIAVKVFAAERLGVSIPGKLSALKGLPSYPDKPYAVDLAKKVASR